MAHSASCALLGRYVFYRNIIKTIDNYPKVALSNLSQTSIVPRLMSTDTESIASSFGNPENKPKKTISKAMKAYLERAKEHDEFMQRELKEFRVGKRHLANMMGEDQDSFTQDDIDKAIEYLFPSGLYDRRAHPIMKHPETIFPSRKAAQFDADGRPFHSMFYTTKPNYYEALYDIVEHMENLNKIEDNEISKGLLPNAANKANLAGSEWMKINDLEKYFLEPLFERDYNAFIAAAERLIDHPYSANVQEYVMRFRAIKKTQTQDLIIPPLEYDSQGRPFIVVKDCKRQTARGTVKILGNGSGKITINGKDITYFKYIQNREQVS